MESAMAKNSHSRNATATWFSVDKEGLSKQAERRGKQFILYELWQNAKDENVTQVTISLKRLPGGMAELEVEDDSPAGFADLSHAYTMFAESKKKSNPEQSGRFNFGEKLVLSLCSEASISSTTGTVIFDASGRHERNLRRNKGSVFRAKLKLNAVEFAEFEQAANRLLVPVGIKATYNGRLLEARPVLASIEETLPTEISDNDGVLRATARRTTVEIVDPVDGETAMLFEMGIPVVETDGRWHINVGQKVPLNMDRDNVTPAYLGKVRALVADHMAEHLSEEDANSTWVRDAVSRHGETMSSDTINRIADLRFGEKRVAYDPSDPEANALAVTRGFTVVHGGTMNRQEWDAVRRVGAILPAGQVTPSPKPFHPDGRPLKLQPTEKETKGMKTFRDYAGRIGLALLGTQVSVTLANDPGWHFLGAYGKGSLTINVARAGYAWFDGPLSRINEFLIHEFGHHYAVSHLSDEYHDALCRLGGQLSQLALEQPELFKR
jgi:hypothetical protein